MFSGISWLAARRASTAGELYFGNHEGDDAEFAVTIECQAGRRHDVVDFVHRRAQFDERNAPRHFV